MTLKILKNGVMPIKLLGVLLVLTAVTSGRAEMEIKVPVITTAPEKVIETDANAWKKNLRFELRAIGEVGGVKVAMIDVNGDPGFVKVGMPFADYRVDEIDVARGQLKLSLADPFHRAVGLTDIVLSLKNLRRVAFPVIGEGKLSWMQSDEGREKMRQLNLPQEVWSVWNRISYEAKEQILLNYLERGLVCTGVCVSDSVYITCGKLIDFKTGPVSNVWRSGRIMFADYINAQNGLHAETRWLSANAGLLSWQACFPSMSLPASATDRRSRRRSFRNLCAVPPMVRGPTIS